MSLYEQLRLFWLDSGFIVNDGIAFDIVYQYERDNDLNLPNTFKDYLLTVNGMKDGETDEHLISFLPLQTIRTKPVSGESTLCDIIFAEFSVFSHYYSLRITRRGQEVAVFAADGSHEKQVASCFEDFIRAYLENPASIAYCWG